MANANILTIYITFSHLFPKSPSQNSQSAENELGKPVFSTPVLGTKMKLNPVKGVGLFF
jgi:hypothetical protein